jgi:hypothetical protein
VFVPDTLCQPILTNSILLLKLINCGQIFITLAPEQVQWYNTFIYIIHIFKSKLERLSFESDSNFLQLKPPLLKELILPIFTETFNGTDFYQ